MCDGCSGCKMEEKVELPLVTSVFLVLTERCNLACKYCFVNQKPKSMTYDLAKDSVDFLIRNAEEVGDTPSINFFGGEPLLKWRDIIKPLVTYIRQEYGKPFNLSITTNGVLLNEEKMNFFKENNVSILLSVDGDKCTQNINRPFHGGRGSFDIVEKAINLVLENDPNATFRATIDHDTAKYFSHNFEFAINKGYQQFFFIPNVFAEWTEEEKEVLKNELRCVVDKIIEGFRNGKILHFKPFEEKIKAIRIINHSISMDRYRDFSDKIGYGKCGLGGGRHASIGTDGTVYGCQEMVSDPSSENIFKIGHIYSGISSEDRMTLISRFDIMKVKGLSCKSCKLNRTCDGSCVANNYIKSGDLNEMTHMLCYWYQILLEEAIRMCAIMGEEKNELFKESYFKKR